MTLDCPVCHDGDLTFDVYNDSDGDGAWARSFTVAEVSRQSCECELTEAQLEALCEEAAERAGEGGQ